MFLFPTTQKWLPPHFFSKGKENMGVGRVIGLGSRVCFEWGLRRVAHPIPGNIQQHPSQAGWGSEAEDGLRAHGHGRGLDLMTFKSPFQAKFFYPSHHARNKRLWPVALPEDTNTMVGPGTTSGGLGGQGGVSDSHPLCLWPLQRAGANTLPGCTSTNPLLLLDPLFSPF